MQLLDLILDLSSTRLHFSADLAMANSIHEFFQKKKKAKEKENITSLENLTCELSSDK